LQFDRQEQHSPDLPQPRSKWLDDCEPCNGAERQKDREWRGLEQGIDWLAILQQPF